MTRCGWCVQDTLIALAKAVASATATLVLKAKEVSNKCDSQADKNAVIGSATQCALAASQLVACTKVVAPTFSNPECQEQLVEAAKQVAKSVENVVETGQVRTMLIIIILRLFSQLTIRNCYTTSCHAGQHRLARRPEQQGLAWANAATNGAKQSRLPHSAVTL